MNSATVSVKAAGRGNDNRKVQGPVDLEELVGNTVQQKNWRGIVISLLVIVIVLSLIVTAIALTTPKNEGGRVGKKITFEDFIFRKLKPREIHPQWITDDHFLYRDIDGSVLMFNCTANQSFVLLDNSSFGEVPTDRLVVSSDLKYVLLPYDTRQIYRHSKLSKYKLLNLNTKMISEFLGPLGPDFRYLTWSPTGHSLVFVQERDIFYQDHVTLGASVQRLTFTGGADPFISNGVPDWVYEEEILQTDHALWWSPNGTYLAYVTFNDSEVRKHTMPFYGSSNRLYVEQQEIPYPKPGTPNPTFELKITNLASNTTRKLQPPVDLLNKEFYFTLVSWQDDDHVIVAWMNRPQNSSILTVCTAENGHCVENFRATALGGWIDIYGPLYHTGPGGQYFLVLPQRDGAAGNFRHIALIDAAVDLTAKQFIEGSKIFITAGKWDVVAIVGFNAESKSIYFTAVKMDDPRERHLYSTSIDSNDKNFRQPTCLSCHLGNECLYVSASFSRCGGHFVLGCLGPGMPSFSLYSTQDIEAPVQILEANEKLKVKLARKALPVVEFVNIPISNGQYLWGKLLLPPVLKKDEIIRYNLLTYVYGSPGSQVVTHKFDIGWEHYLSSSHGLVIGYVDARGTSGRGENWLHAIYKHLGTVEVDDTITAGRYFFNLPYVSEKIAIWGWSYGGFLSASVLGREQDVFKCGISVAPVTDWRYYDSVYTERYMGQPTASDNLEAYNFANVSRSAANFKKTGFLVVHGTGDDNVHFQNSAQLIKALTSADVYFRAQVYTDEHHQLNRGNTETHLYNTMENFLFRCYGRIPNPPPVEDDED